MPNPALAKEQMRAAIVRRSRKKASTQYHRPNAVGKAPRAIVDHFAPKGASEVSLWKADGRWPGARIRAAGQIAPPSWPGRAPGARGVEPERDQNKGDAPEWWFILSISAIYFEIINCFNLIHLLISIPPSTKAVMKRQLSYHVITEISQYHIMGIMDLRLSIMESKYHIMYHDIHATQHA